MNFDLTPEYIYEVGNDSSFRVGRFLREEARIFVHERFGHEDLLKMAEINTPDDTGLYMGTLAIEGQPAIAWYGRSDNLKIGGDDSPERDVTIDRVLQIAEGTGVKITRGF
jgi:hypothetical protein